MSQRGDIIWKKIIELFCIFYFGGHIVWLGGGHGSGHGGSYDGGHGGSGLGDASYYGSQGGSGQRSCTEGRSVQK